VDRQWQSAAQVGCSGGWRIGGCRGISCGAGAAVAAVSEVACGVPSWMLMPQQFVSCNDLFHQLRLCRDWVGSVALDVGTLSAVPLADAHKRKIRLKTELLVLREKVRIYAILPFILPSE
jgi:hypothetical protein